MTTYEQLKPRLANSPFRRRFHLSEKDRAYLAEKGMDAVVGEVRSFIQSRLAPANPVNDGKQTPMRGHPCFVAQHATGCCCRDCLRKWHGISAGHPLTEPEIDSIVQVITAYLTEELESGPAILRTPGLWDDATARRVTTENLRFPDFHKTPKDDS